MGTVTLLSASFLFSRFLQEPPRSHGNVAGLRSVMLCLKSQLTCDVGLETLDRVEPPLAEGSPGNFHM